MQEYDVIVVGGGPGGYVAAIRASQLGLKTALVEKEWLGGVCLNVGCIPSKSLLKNAEVAHLLHKRGREFGFRFDNLKIDYGTAVKRSRQISNRLTKGVGFLMKKHGIEVITGTGRLTARDRVEIIDPQKQVSEIKGKDIILATGAKPISIPGIVVDGERVLTYREAILQDKIPESVIIVGSGAIGVEFATVWNSYGVDVTIVEMLPRLVPLEDEEVSAELAKSFKKSKIKVLTGTKVETVQIGNEGVEIKVSSENGEQVLTADQALMAIGFRPNSTGLGLEEVGVHIDRRGAVEIDERMATNVPGIWAIGDLTAKLMLAHIASAQGTICAENIAGVETTRLDYQMMPRATYCRPQIASFGLTENQAIDQERTIKVGRFPFQANGKALGLGESSGWIKIISDERDGEILGAHMIGPEVTELLPELTLAQMMKCTPSDIGRNIHAHPTLSEALMEAAHATDGHAIHI